MASDDPNDEVPLHLRPVAPAINGPARKALDTYLQSWQPGMRVVPEDLLKRAKTILLENPARWGKYNQTVNMQHVIDVVDTYEIMGWAKVERPSDGSVVVVDVMPIFAKQSEMTRGEFIGRRQQADKARQRLKDDREVAGDIPALLDISIHDDLATLATKLRKHNMEITVAMPPGFHSNAIAIVLHHTTGHKFKAGGADVSEAVCNAAAMAFKGFMESAPESQA
ncbi:MAG: hypothetical protein M3464_01135 [Chloroflexota bacterium]|nr:hypothetical protein [Chloroflexota bacterium]